VDASDYTQYRPLMFSIAYRMTGSVGDAEDIVQEAFFRATKGKTKGKQPDNLGPVSQVWHLRSGDQTATGVTPARPAAS
jgi:hypothetical protein